jgi:uncharacterized protein (DUF4415 family)
MLAIEATVDPDDAPELTDDFFETGAWKIGERDVSRAEGQAMMRQTLHGNQSVQPKPQRLTILCDADIVYSFQALDADWQTRMNDIVDLK